MTGEALIPEQPEGRVTEAQIENAETGHKRNVSEWRKLIMFVVTLFVFVLGSSYYANWKAERTARENDQRWCSLLGTMDAAYQQNPPTTPTGRKLAQDIHGLHEGFQCGKTKP